MYKLSCKSMGGDCGFEAEGATPEEVKMKIKEHAMAEHKDMMMKMSEDEKMKMMAMMDEKIEMS